MTKKVFVYLEINNNEIEKVSKEIICEAQKNFDNIELCAIVLADENAANALTNDLKSLGVSKVFVIKDNLLDFPNTEIYSNVLSKFIQNTKPDILLMGATDFGRDLAPRTASNLNIGLTADCTALSLDEDGQLLATRPTYGGKMMATIISKTSPNFATIRPGAFKLDSLDSHKTTEIIQVDADIAGFNSLIEILHSEKKLPAEDWTCAEIIVSGGLGLKTKENFELIYQLADKLNAKPAASRAAVELGWAPQEIQVGQTGSSVSPKLYLAFGISGAMQHLVGISNSDRIIAVNTNKSAPIMQSSDVAIVNDAVLTIKQMLDSLD